jgi:hypothetical protein
MRNFTRLNFFCLLLIGLCIGSCGGGSTQVAAIDGSGITPPPPPTDAVAFGTVTGFGSIIVNGVTYDTTDAVFTVNREAGTQDDLAIGDVVLINGTINDDGETGDADNVEYDDNVQGVIDSIDLAGNTLVVLGQVVRVTPDTSFGDSIVPAMLSSLSVGDTIEVSGFVDSEGEIGASRIERLAIGSSLEITGVVTSLDTGNNRFSINALVVDYSQATVEEFPASGIGNQQIVEVIGNAISGAGEFVASRVIFRQNRFGVEQGDHVEIEGFVTRFVSGNDFDVNGVPTAINNETTFPTGQSALDLRLNEKIEVEGAIDQNGVLVASVVRFLAFTEFGNFHFEPDGGLNGAGLLTDHASDQPGPPGSALDYSGRIALPGCASTPAEEWFISAGRETIGSTRVLRAFNDDLIIDIVNAGAFDGCYGATATDNGLLEISLKQIGNSCDAYFEWDFGYAGTATGVEYFHIESQNWQQLAGPFDSCDGGGSIRLTGDYDFSRITENNGTRTSEFLSTEAMDFYVVFHLCPGGTGCN